MGHLHPSLLRQSTVKPVTVVVDPSGSMLSASVNGGDGLTKEEALVAAARLMEFVYVRYGIPYAAMVEVASERYGRVNKEKA